MPSWSSSPSLFASNGQGSQPSSIMSRSSSCPTITHASGGPSSPPSSRPPTLTCVIPKTPSQPAPRHAAAMRISRIWRDDISSSLILDKRLEALAARRMAQLAERLGFDLPDTLARHLEVLTHFLESVVALLADAEAHAEDLL